jgi:hypothetical protein
VQLAACNLYDTAQVAQRWSSCLLCWVKSKWCVHEARGREQTHNVAYLFVRHPFHCAPLLCTCVRRTAAPTQVQGVRRVHDTPTHTVPATCRDIQTQVKHGMSQWRIMPAKSNCEGEQLGDNAPATTHLLCSWQGERSFDEEPGWTLAPGSLAVK